MKSAIPAVVWLIGAISVGYTTFFMWPGLSSASPQQIGPLLRLLGWAAVPFVLLGVWASVLTQRVAAEAILGATAAVACIGGFYMFLRVYLAPPDPQANLVFVVVPFYQLILAAIGCGIAVGVSRMRSQRVN